MKNLQRGNRVGIALDQSDMDDDMMVIKWILKCLEGSKVIKCTHEVTESRVFEWLDIMTTRDSVIRNDLRFLFQVQTTFT